MARGGRGDATGKTQVARAKSTPKADRRASRDRFWKERQLQKEYIQKILADGHADLNNVVVAVTLSNTQYERLKDYCWILELVSTDTGFYWKPTKSKGTKFSTSGTGLLLTTAESLEQQSAKIFYSGHGSKTALDDLGVVTNSSSSQSTLVVLCLWAHEKIDPNDRERSNFDNKHLTALATRTKPNINSGNKHHGSGGYCVGFGVRAAFDRIDPNTQASFGPYAYKDRNVAPALKADVSNMLQDWTVTAIEKSVNRLNKLLNGNIVRDGSVMIESAVALCHTRSELLKEQIELLGSTKFTSAYLNVNVGVEHEHQEKDASYTLISVPVQKADKATVSSPIEFHFRLNSDCCLIVPMPEMTDLYYSGFFVAHRQMYCADRAHGSDFYNVSAYGNRRLIQNIQTTLNRIV